jgi:CHAT domain-containing protein
MQGFLAALGAPVFAVVAATTLRADSLPIIPLNLPEGHLDGTALDRVFELARAMQAAEFVLLDPPSLGALAPYRERLAEVLASADAEIAERWGPHSRAMAVFLSRSLAARDAVAGWPAYLEAARRAVAIERQLSVNALFFGSYWPDTWEAAATGVETEVLGDVLMDLQFQLDLAAAPVRFDTGERPSPAMELVFELAQAGFSGGMSADLVRAGWRDPAMPGKELADLVFQTEAMMDDHAQLMAYLDAGLELPGPDATLASMQATQDEVMLRLDRILTSGVDVAELYLPSVQTLEDVRAALAEDEALVMLMPAGALLIVIAVTRDEVVLRQAQGELQDLLDTAETLRAAVGRDSGRAATALPGAEPRLTQDGDLRAAAALAYDQLLRPVEAVIRDKPRLLVAATADVGLGFPFEMMLTAPAPEGAANADLDWLVKRHAVQLVPNLAALAARAQWSAPQDPAAQVYLGLGGADYALPSQLGRSNGMTRMLMELRPLPESTDEVRAVAAAFGQERSFVLSGADASEFAVLELSANGALGGVTVLHFATHGLVFGDHPDVGESLIALTPMLDVAGLTEYTVGQVNLPRPDGALQDHEIRQLHLSARLVILSACSTGLATYDADGLGSLAGAFLSAGADRVLATHWPVASSAAVEIVTGMAARDPGFADPQMALRDSIVAVMAQGGRKADPAYWAAFTLIGRP